eukprot:scaffold188292_cov22-Tisochrysis_lutea.AAC.2
MKERDIFPFFDMAYQTQCALNGLPGRQDGALAWNGLRLCAGLVRVQWPTRLAKWSTGMERTETFVQTQCAGAVLQGSARAGHSFSQCTVLETKRYIDEILKGDVPSGWGASGDWIRHPGGRYRTLAILMHMFHQGFASGDCERDAKAIRLFLADGHQLGCSQSYAKNMGLYGQRVGAFSIGSKSTANWLNEVGQQSR